MTPVDIFIASYLRDQYTEATLGFLKRRTKYPHRTFLLDNGGNERLKDQVDIYVGMGTNLGIHALWNIAAALAESPYMVTSDNDIFVPNLDPDWLTQLVKFMDERPEYGAISLHPHVFIGAAGIDPEDPEDVKERNMAGGGVCVIWPPTLPAGGGGGDSV